MLLNTRIIMLFVFINSIIFFSCSRREENILTFDNGFNTNSYNQGIVLIDDQEHFYFTQNYDDYKVLFYNLSAEKTDSIYLHLATKAKVNINFINKDTILSITNKNYQVRFQLLNREGGVLKDVFLKNNIDNDSYTIPANKNHSLLNQNYNNLFFTVYNKFSYEYTNSFPNFKSYKLAQSNTYIALNIQDDFKEEYLGLKGFFTPKEYLPYVVPSYHKFYNFDENFNVAFSNNSNKIFFFDDTFGLQKEVEILNKSVLDNSQEYIENVLYDKVSNKFAVVIFKLKEPLNDRYFHQVEIESSYVKIYNSDMQEISTIALDMEQYNPQVIFLIKNKLYVELNTNTYGQIKYEIFDI